MQCYEKQNEPKKGIMQDAWKRASESIASHDNPWEHVRGPAGATIATYEEVNWHMYDWDKVTTDLGKDLRLSDVRLALILDHVGEAIDRMLWHKSEAAKQDRTGTEGDWENDAPWWYPVREIINGKDRAAATAARPHQHK